MSRWWLFLFVLLSAAPVARIGDVQILEMLQIACLALAVPVFAARGLKVPVTGLWRELGAGYLILLCLCAAAALASLRLTFYTPPSVSILKQPLWISLARIFELFLVIYFMLRTARAAGRNPRLFRTALDLYVGIGTLSACLSVAAWGLVKTARVAMFAVYGPDQRVRGFFNEGGPFGIFLVSVAVVALLRWRLFPMVNSVSRWLILAVLGAALVLSQSKAALLVAAGLCAVAVLWAGSRMQKIALLSAVALILTAGLSLFGGKVFGYFYAYLNIEEALAYRPDDPSLIMGRIAASVIVPKMIEAHPLMGVGVGNYSLMRNDPEYLQNLPPVSEWDLPGMGLAGSAAELGIPLTLLLLGLLLRPLALARKTGQTTLIAVAASFQPLAILMGVNLNFFYPWLVGAFVLAVGGMSEAKASR